MTLFLQATGINSAANVFRSATRIMVAYVATSRVIQAGTKTRYESDSSWVMAHGNLTGLPMVYHFVICCFPLPIESSKCLFFPSFFLFFFFLGGAKRLSKAGSKVKGRGNAGSSLHLQCL